MQDRLYASSVCSRSPPFRVNWEVILNVVFAAFSDCNEKDDDGVLMVKEEKFKVLRPGSPVVYS